MKLFEEKFKSFSEKFDHHSAKSGFETSNCKFINILKRNFKKKRNGSKIHDGCISSLSKTNEQKMCTIESTKMEILQLGRNYQNVLRKTE